MVSENKLVLCHNWTFKNMLVYPHLFCISR